MTGGCPDDCRTSIPGLSGSVSAFANVNAFDAFFRVDLHLRVAKLLLYAIV